MSYYTIDLSNGKEAWTYKEFGSIGRYNSLEDAQEIAEYLLKSERILHYVITKNEHEIVKTKDKELPAPKTEKKKDKIIYVIQYESCIPYKWIDMKIEFTNKDHAQLILEHQSKMSSDTAYRLVQREYSYEETVLQD